MRTDVVKTATFGGDTIFEFLKRFLEKPPQPIQYEPKGMSTAEKDRIITERATTAEMAALTMMPYQLDRPVRKYLEPHGHPFAWIEFDEYNEIVAKNELAGINGYIDECKLYCRQIPRKLAIPVERIMFHEYDSSYGYTRLICRPLTVTGKPAKYPLLLRFMTDERSAGDFVTGELSYGRDGSIMKGTVTIWERGVMYQFILATVGRSLVVKEVKSSKKPDKNGLPSTIYQLADARK